MDRDHSRDSPGGVGRGVSIPGLTFETSNSRVEDESPFPSGVFLSINLSNLSLTLRSLFRIVNTSELKTISPVLLSYSFLERKSCLL